MDYYVIDKDDDLLLLRLKPEADITKYGEIDGLITNNKDFKITNLNFIQCVADKISDKLIDIYGLEHDIGKNPLIIRGYEYQANKLIRVYKYKSKLYISNNFKLRLDIPMLSALNPDNVYLFYLLDDKVLYLGDNKINGNNIITPDNLTIDQANEYIMKYGVIWLKTGNNKWYQVISNEYNSKLKIKGNVAPLLRIYQLIYKSYNSLNTEYTLTKLLTKLDDSYGSTGTIYDLYNKIVERMDRLVNWVIDIANNVDEVNYLPIPRRIKDIILSARYEGKVGLEDRIRDIIYRENPDTLLELSMCIECYDNV